MRGRRGEAKSVGERERTMIKDKLNNIIVLYIRTIRFPLVENHLWRKPGERIVAKMFNLHSTIHDSDDFACSDNIRQKGKHPTEI